MVGPMVKQMPAREKCPKVFSSQAEVTPSPAAHVNPCEPMHAQYSPVQPTWLAEAGAGKVKEELCLRMTPNVPGHLLASSTDLTLSSCSYSTIEQSAQCFRNIIML